MIKNLLVILIVTSSLTMGKAQQASDTVIVELAKTSRVIFTIKDRADLEILKHYDFQQLFQDVLLKLEKNDTTALAKRDSTETSPDIAAEDEGDDDKDDEWRRDRNDDEDDDDDDDDFDHDKSWRNHVRGNRWGRTWQSFNFDLGTNNYLADGSFPDNDNALHSVRP